jgi:hypothetical protein
MPFRIEPAVADHIGSGAQHVFTSGYHRERRRIDERPDRRHAFTQLSRVAVGFRLTALLVSRPAMAIMTSNIPPLCRLRCAPLCTPVRIRSRTTAASTGDAPGNASHRSGAKLPDWVHGRHENRSHVDHCLMHSALRGIGRLARRLSGYWPPATRLAYSRNSFDLGNTSCA